VPLLLESTLLKILPLNVKNRLLVYLENASRWVFGRPAKAFEASLADENFPTCALQNRAIVGRSDLVIGRSELVDGPFWVLVADENAPI
jgi:hypothetical protein